jgi:hypothetical protein
MIIVEHRNCLLILEVNVEMRWSRIVNNTYDLTFMKATWVLVYLHWCSVDYAPHEEFMQDFATTTLASG